MEIFIGLSGGNKFEVRQSVAGHSYVIGVQAYDKVDSEKYKAKGEDLKINIIGLLHLDDDFPSCLASQAIESIQVCGVLHAMRLLNRLFQIA